MIKSTTVLTIRKFPASWRTSNRVLVMADEETLKRMASVAKDAESPLLATLRNSDDAAAALAVLEVSIVRPQVMAFLAFTKLPAPFDAAPYDGIKKVPVNIDEAIVKLNVSPLLSIKADMRAKDEDAAIATDTFLANVIDKISRTVRRNRGRAGRGARSRGCRRGQTVGAAGRPQEHPQALSRRRQFERQLWR